VGAIHLHPEEARRRIRKGAERAILRLRRIRLWRRRARRQKNFGVIPLRPPFERLLILRAQGDLPKRISVETHPSDVIALMNMPFSFKPLEEKGK
jgi:hypothetical protein